MAELEIIAQNIRRLRKDKGMKQADLANVACISLPALKSIELVKSEPRIGTLTAIAAALSVNLQILLTPIETLSSVRFRSKKKLRIRESIIDSVAKWLKDYNYIENLLGEKKHNKLNSIRNSVLGKSPAEVAEKCRVEFGLNPNTTIRDICGLLENEGIKVYAVSKESEKFFGLSVNESDSCPAIVINTDSNITVERQIFTAAHELGHILLHQGSYVYSETEENKLEEGEANQFGGYFLMPQNAFLREWDAASGLHYVARILKVKQFFNVSFSTVIYRLVDCNAADSSLHMKFRYDYERLYNRKIAHKSEPLPLNQFLFSEGRLSALVRQAVNKNKIEVTRGAEILGISIEEMAERLKNIEVAC